MFFRRILSNLSILLPSDRPAIGIENDLSQSRHAESDVNTFRAMNDHGSIVLGTRRPVVALRLIHCENYVCILLTRPNAKNIY